MVCRSKVLKATTTDGFTARRTWLAICSDALLVNAKGNKVAALARPSALRTSISDSDPMASA